MIFCLKTAQKYVFQPGRNKFTILENFDFLWFFSSFHEIFNLIILCMKQFETKLKKSTITINCIDLRTFWAQNEPCSSNTSFTMLLWSQNSVSYTTVDVIQDKFPKNVTFLKIFFYNISNAWDRLFKLYKIRFHGDVFKYRWFLPSMVILMSEKTMEKLN